MTIPSNAKNDGEVPGHADRLAAFADGGGWSDTDALRADVRAQLDGTRDALAMAAQARNEVADLAELRELLPIGGDATPAEVIAAARTEIVERGGEVLPEIECPNCQAVIRARIQSAPPERDARPAGDDTAPPADPRIPIMVEALGDYPWSHRLAPGLLARLDAAAGPRAADTAPPARDRLSAGIRRAMENVPYASEAENLPVHEFWRGYRRAATEVLELIEQGHVAAAGPRAGDAPNDEPDSRWGGANLATCGGTDCRCADTAPDDERDWVSAVGRHDPRSQPPDEQAMSGDGSVDLDRLRSDAAALRAAGDALAAAVWTLLAARRGDYIDMAALAWSRASDAADAWRSAAGSPTETEAER